LSKIYRTIQKVAPDGPHEVFLVLDATTGQNAVNQAQTFNGIVPLTGLVLTKLDGTAKGGIILNIKKVLNIPVKLIGVGEGIEDLQDFDAQEFVNAMFN
ncbi:MAG: signal recognition particle-docking protein FtsY, partial [Candidatus Cloacimonadales bacterium]